MPLLSDCGNKDGKSRVARRLKKRPGLARRLIMLKGMKSGLSRAEAKEAADEAVAQLAEMTERDITDLVTEAMTDDDDS